MKRRRQGKVTRIDTALKPVLREMGRGKQGFHPEIWSRWIDIAGAEIAAKAVPRFLRGKILHLAVTSSTWMQELAFLKKQLLERLGEEVGEGIVDDIRLTLDPTVGGSQKVMK